jgi:hypothetical protein
VTGGEYSEVDVDLLADYVGGALHGTAEEARVARLIADDAAWRAAYHGLSTAVDLVGADLRALGTATGPMPDDVADRLDAALAAVAPPAPPASAPPARHLTVVAGGGGDGDARADGDRGRRPSPGADVSALPVGTGGAASAAARRRRWRRWAGPTAVAAGVLAFAAFGVNQLTGQGVQSSNDAAGQSIESNADTSAGGVSSEEPKVDVRGAPNPAGGVPPGRRVIASGTDYDRTRLAGQAKDLTGLESSGEEPPQPQRPAAALPSAADRSLGRLGQGPALTSCLDAVERVHGEGPVTVEVIDYASFEGRPALVVFFVDRDGDRWAWVTGRACGLPEAGADTRFSTPVR